MPIGLRIRRPAVAGTFYPADEAVLGSLVDRLVAEAREASPANQPVPKAVIVPHAGYIYSGPVAASAYARLAPAAGRIARVVMFGPAHFVRFEGAGGCRRRPARDAARHLAGPAPRPAGVIVSARAHAREHALEVQVPFLQRVLGDVELVPLLVGEASAESVAEVMDALWGDTETLVLVSSDLSHYHDWPEANRLDAESAAHIEALGPPLGHHQACGATAINGLLVTARRRGLRVERLDLRNSGDTAGPRDRVVGYGAFAFHEPEPRT